MRAIQLGIGGMGNTWLSAVQRSTEVEFAACVEINDAIADQQAAAYGLDCERIFRTLPEALAQVSADFVIDVTPPQFHRENSLAALEAGLPVLSEKPLAHTLEDARAIANAAEKSRLLHSVAQNYRYRPLSRTIKRVLDSGELGAVGAVSVEFYKGPHFGGFREAMPQPLLIDMAIHHFDMLRYFLSSDARRISATSWNPPWSWFDGDASASAQIEFGDGVQASYAGSWCAQAMETSWNGSWRFDCERGVLLAVDDRVYMQRLLSVDEGARGVASQHDEKREIPLESMPREGQDYLLHEFVQALRSGSRTATHAQDNIRTMELVFGAVRACERGETISLD